MDGTVATGGSDRTVHDTGQDDPGRDDTGRDDPVEASSGRDDTHLRRWACLASGPAHGGRDSCHIGVGTRQCCAAARDMAWHGMA